MTWSFCLRPRPPRMSRPNPNEHRLTDCLHVCSTCLSDPRDEFLYLESPPDSVTCTRGDATAARVCETLVSSHVKSTKIECISFSLSNDESPTARGRSPVRTARGEISHLALRLGLWCGGVGSLCRNSICQLPHSHALGTLGTYGQGREEIASLSPPDHLSPSPREGALAFHKLATPPQPSPSHVVFATDHCEGHCVGL